MKKILLFSFIGLLAACSGNKKQDGHVEIHGKLDSLKDQKKIYLEVMNPDGFQMLDSTEIIDNHFEFNFTPEEPGFYAISFNRDNFVTLLVDSNEVINFTADARQLYKNYQVSGSPGSQLIQDFNKNRQNTYLKIDSLVQFLDNIKISDSMNFYKPKIDAAFDSLFKLEQDFTYKFIRKNISSLASLIALYQPLGQQQLFPLDQYFNLYISIDSSLMINHARSKHAQGFHAKISQAKAIRDEKFKIENALKIGAVAPDLKLPDPESKIVALSSLKGKIVLLDFWASWCRPCRAVNPKLRDIYKKYSGKDFEIYAVSLDKELKFWKDAIKMDKINWIHVSDLGGWESNAAKTFNITEIPNNYLLDKNGVIVAKNLTPEELDAKLGEMVNGTR